MATREKSVMYSFPMLAATLADNVLTSLGTITITIAENSVAHPVTFTDVYAELAWGDMAINADNAVAETRVDLQLGAAAADSYDDVETIPSTGERQSGVNSPIDFTAYFNANFGTGTSQTCQVWVLIDQGGTAPQGTNNINIILHIAYTFDDSAATRTKTVRIPLEGTNIALPQIETEYGTNQIPKLYSGDPLTDFLPEANVIVKDYFFVFEGNENQAVVNDITVNVKIDGGATLSSQAIERGLATSSFDRLLFRYTGSEPALNTTHAFKLWVNQGSFAGATVELVVTYTYTVLGTTKTIQSLYLPFSFDCVGFSQLESITDARQKTVVIQALEAGVSLKQSAVKYLYTVLQASTNIFKNGAQASVSVANTTLTYAGQTTLQYRIDSGSSLGSAFASFASGKNNLTLYVWSSSGAGTITYFPIGIIILNYHSTVNATDPDAATRTINKRLLEFTNDKPASTITKIDVTTAFAIAESNFYISHAVIINSTYNSTTYLERGVFARLGVGEGIGSGNRTIFSWQLSCDQESAIFWDFNQRLFDNIKRWNGDPDANRLNIETSRNWMLRVLGAYNVGGFMFCLTYNALAYTISGTLTGYAGDGSGVVCRLIDDTTGELLLETTSAIGGTFSFVWYDNVSNKYVEAYEDATHNGRSAVLTNETSVTIALSDTLFYLDSLNFTNCTTFGSNDGTITLVAGGGSGNYEYSNDAGGTWQALGTFTGLAAGTYECQLRDATTLVTIDDIFIIISEPAIQIGEGIIGEIDTNEIIGVVT